MAALASYVKTRFPLNFNFVKNGRILMKFDMKEHMNVLIDFMLFSFSEKNQDGHDVIIADFSKWFNLLEILYKYSSWCALIEIPKWPL